MEKNRFQLTEEEVAKRKFEEEHRGYDVYMEDAMRRGEYRYPVKKEETHINYEEMQKHLMEKLGPIMYRDLKVYRLI